MFFADLIFANVTGVILKDIAGSQVDLHHEMPDSLNIVPEQFTAGEWNIKLLPAGYFPMDVSADGTIVLLQTVRDFDLFYRWSNGEMEKLGRPETYYGAVSLNREGVIAMSKDALGLPPASYLAEWAPMNKSFQISYNAHITPVINYGYYGEAFTEYIGRAALQKLDNQNRKWFYLYEKDDTYSSNTNLKRSLIAKSASGAETIIFSDWGNSNIATEYELNGVSGKGSSIYSSQKNYNTTNERHFFFNNIELNFIPKYISENDFVIGAQFIHSGTFYFERDLVIRFPDGNQEPAFKGSGTVTWVDSQDRLRGDGPASVGPGVFVRTMGPNGQPIPGQYEFLPNVPLPVPFGWTTTHTVAPGTLAPQIGIMINNSTGASRPFVATRNFQLTVDANRDGTIKLASEDNSDATSSANPHRFWLNDDDDQPVDSSQTGLYTELELDDRDVAVTHQADWTDNQISPNGTRDLEDFMRLWIDVSSLKDQINTGDIRIGLKWTDVSDDAPAVKIFRTSGADDTGSLKYLTDVTVAKRQIEARAVYDVTLGGNDHTLMEGTGTLILANFEFSKDQLPYGKAYWLLEGCKAGKGQLRVVILDKNGVEIGIGPGVWLDLKEPKEFVERWSCGDDPLGTVQPVMRVNSKSGIFASPVTDEEKDYVLYVHGYNMQEFEKQRWLETTYKRLWHLGYKGRVGSFSWPCSDSALPYDQSEERAWQSAAQLRALLSSLKTAGYRVHVLGHSQGNVVVGEALRQWKEAGNIDALVRTYIASQAAIQAHCYDASAALIPGFAGSFTDDGTPNVYANYPSTGAPYMSAAAMSGAATRFRNFENPRDYALTGNSLDLFDFHPGWQANQRLKPDQGVGYNSVDGFFESTATGFSPLRLPADRFRIFSYAAEGRSLALGSTATGGVFTNGDLDLSLAPHSFGREHLFHSGQFRASMAERNQYWAELLRTIGITPISP